MVVSMPGRERMELLVPQLAAAAREHPELAAVAVPPGLPGDQVPKALPTDLRRLAVLSDGLVFGVSAKIRLAQTILGFQYTETLAEAAEISNAEDYLTIGDVLEAPLLFNVTDGSIWRTLASGGLWYQGCRIERVADDLDEFLSGWIASPRFRELADLEEVEPGWDDWWRLLQAAGRVPA
jgi:hypothetical protein